MQIESVSALHCKVRRVPRPDIVHIRSYRYSKIGSAGTRKKWRPAGAERSFSEPSWSEAIICPASTS